MPIAFVLIYIAACVVCGFMGRNTTIGFIGHFILSVFLTPLGDFLLQAAGRMSARAVDRLRTKP